MEIIGIKKNKNRFKIINFFPVILLGLFLFLSFSGCATSPVRENIQSYSLNGTVYYPLAPICKMRSIDWQYDTFSRQIYLTRENHEVKLSIGQDIAIVDGRSMNIGKPVELFNGMVVIPEVLKERVVDSLFTHRFLSDDKASVQKISIKKIVIDPGHGGKDPGAIGRTGLREKDVNLDVAKRLAKILKSQGVEVVLTRSSDIFVSLARRVDIANKSNADLFISIHSNANRARSLNGFEIYYISPRVGDSNRALTSAKSTPLGYSEQSALLKSNINIKAVVWDMIHTYNRAESIELANSICKNVGRDLNTKILGVKDARFYVLKGVDYPSILIEIGFLSNRQEERQLRNSFYRQQIAESISQGIIGYARELSIAQVN